MMRSPTSFIKFTSHFVAAILLYNALTTQNAQGTEPLATANYKIHSNNWISIQVRVNGQGPYDFKIDTGSMVSAPSTSVHNELKFKKSEQERTIIRPYTVETKPHFEIGEIAINDKVKISNLSSHIGPDYDLSEFSNEGNERLSSAPLRGYLGLDLLSKYVFTFDPCSDPDNKQVRIYAPQERSDTDRSRVISLKKQTFEVKDEDGKIQREAALYVIQPEIKSRKLFKRPTSIDMLFDTGATITYVNEKAREKIGSKALTNDESPAILFKQIINADTNEYSSEKIPLNHIKVARVTIGQFSASPAIIALYDAPVLSSLGKLDEPFGLFGIELFKDLSFTLDLPNQEIRFAGEQCVEN